MADSHVDKECCNMQVQYLLEEMEVEKVMVIKAVVLMGEMKVVVVEHRELEE